VVDGLKVHGDDARLAGVARKSHDIVCGHHDRVALQEARTACVHDNRVGLVLVQ
jgi:hypothetical protein